MALVMLSDSSVLPFTILSIIVILLFIVILIQCVGKKEDTNEIKDGHFRKCSSYENTLNQVESQDVESQKESVDGKIDKLEDSKKDEKSRSLTVNSTNSNCSNAAERPKHPTPLPDRNKSGKLEFSETQNHPSEKVSSVKEKETSKDEVNNQTVENKSRVPNGGSVENSGSGDSIYTKVKSVPPKEECAYSVVELASRDAEYEMVEGKLKRLEKPVKHEVQKIDNNEYELISSFTPKRRPSLDPVLFAVEDSGASGIYEDVPDSKVSGNNQQLATNEPSKQTVEKSEPGKIAEQKSKKWGLTRFSIKNRGKKKSDITADQTDHPGNHKESPKSSDEKSYLSDASDSNDNTSERKKKQLQNKGKSSLVDPSTPPPPPIENLKFKIDHRRTIHVTETALDQSHGIPPRPPSTANASLLTGAKWLVATPNEYTVVDQKEPEIAENSEDMLYEEPDRDVITPTHVSPRHVAKETNKNDANSKKSMDYETISCDIDLTIEENSSQDKTKEILLSDEKKAPETDTTEPPYAVVKRKNTKKGSFVSNDNLESDINKSQRSQTANSGEKKIEVFITKTSISTHLNDESDFTTEKTPEAAENSGVRDMNSSEETRDDEVKDLEAMYAKVDMVKKREDQAKRALYASVNKEKTGVYKFYDDDDEAHEMTTEEFEDGHYTKIKDEVPVDACDDSRNDDTISEKNEQKKDKTDTQPISDNNEYELLTEQKTVEMFSSLRNSKRNNQKVDLTGSPEKGKTMNETKKVVKKSYSDYEEI